MNLREGLRTFMRRHPRSFVTRLSMWVLRAFCSRTIPLDRLLAGGENGLTGREFARLSGDWLRPSLPLSETAQVKLLQRYVEVGAETFAEGAFRETAYYRNARTCIETGGPYLGASTDAEILALGKALAAQLDGEEPGGPRGGISEHVSIPGKPVVVTPVLHSDCYEIWDGHHRLALAYMRGDRTCRARIMGPPTPTPLQELVMMSSYSGGGRTLAQPLSTPEFGEDWPVARRCEDRFDMMTRFMKAQGILPGEARTFLDVGCRYGWFVRAFEDLGFTARGVEEDEAAVKIGRISFRLAEEAIQQADVVASLRSESRGYDVTACLGWMHHAILEGGPAPPERILSLVAARTNLVLFFEMGQEHERGYRDRLRGWSADRIEEWLALHTGFARIQRLGTDHDGVGPLAGQYGRVLFACTR